jgi:hypothetical protein
MPLVDMLGLFERLVDSHREATMRRSVKKGRRSVAGAPAARGPFDLGGVPLGRTTHPPDSTRRGGGRLGGALRMARSKPPTPVGKQPPTAKALARWENEGGRPAPRATPEHAKKIEATQAPKKSVAKHSPKKAKPKPGTGTAKGRR